MFEERDEFTVTLISNASYDIYPDNNVFSFNTILAKPLHFDLNEDWRVCLQSISITNISDDPLYDKHRSTIYRKVAGFKKALRLAKTKTKTNTAQENLKALQILYAQSNVILQQRIELFNLTNIVFVKCDEINPLFESASNISSFVIPPLLEKEGEFMFYEPSTEEYFNLTSPILEKISIKILNPTGLKIYRTVAQPTVLVLKFKKMKHLQKSYTINVTNKEQNPADFYTTFPYLPIKDGDNNPWEIAVTRVNLIPCFRKFPRGKFVVTVVKDVNDFSQNFSVGSWETYLTDKPRGVGTFEYHESPTNAVLISIIQEAFEVACNSLGLTGYFRKHNKTLSFRIETRNAEKGDSYIIILPEELIYVLGFDSDGIVFKNGFGGIPTRTSKKIVAKRQINTNFLIPQNLLLYSDCVTPSLVGDVYGQYLTNIPIPRLDTTPIDIPYTVYEPKNLEFHPFQRNQIETVRMRLLKTDGNAPEFVVNNVQIFISLLIRETKKNN